MTEAPVQPPSAPTPAPEGVLAGVLPWVQTQRWFHSDWPTTGWTEAYLHQLGHTSILIARPEPRGPWLQLPLVGGGADATGTSEFWSDWLALSGSDARLLSVELMGREQSNTSVILHTSQGSWVTKLYRVVFPGDNPDVVLPLRLMEAGFPAIAPVRTYLRLSLPDGDTFLSGVATDLVADATTARDYFISLAEDGKSGESDAYDLGFLLGQMHAALPPTGDKAASGLLSGRLAQVYQGAKQAIDASDVNAALPALDTLLEDAERASIDKPLSPIHGDLHLEQILRGPDGHWTIIDFEGEPLRTLQERLRPDFPLRDLAGVLRSFDYAVHFNPTWVAAAERACRAGYVDATGTPIDEKLLRLFIIEKALYEVTYEATYRPGWLWIPLRVFA